MKNAIVLSYCRPTSSVIVDPVHGRDGLWGASVLIDDLYFFVSRDEGWEQFRLDLLAQPGQIACWDLRRMIDWPLDDRRVVWEVKSLYGGDRSLPSLARAREKDPACLRYLELDQRVVAHARALKTALIAVPHLQALPPELLRDWLFARTSVMQGLLRDAPSTDYEDRWPFIRSLREMELNGIHVDLALARQLLDGMPSSAPAAAALRSLCGLCRGGLVTALFNPMGGKTGRVRHEGGFNALAIPKGAAREVLTSRFEAGKICSFDFNASDYRCIVRSIGGEVAQAYAGAQDFHWRTLELLCPGVDVRAKPERRKLIKKITYTYAYGGSDETLQRQTGLTKAVLDEILQRLDERLGAIAEFRARLWMGAQEFGYVEIPGGRRVAIHPDDSPGKVLGLYAQSYSSWVFEQAMLRAQRVLRGKRSKLIFEVHDELVADFHPEELGLVEEVRKAMEQDGHVVKARMGASYGAATE